MKISKKSWLYRLAYASPFYFLQNKSDRARAKALRPNRVSLCKLFWKLLFRLFIAMPLESVVCVIIVVIVGIAKGIGFLFGAKVVAINNDLDVVPIERWPRIAGFRILPGGIGITAVTMYAAWWTLSQVVGAMTDMRLGRLKDGHLTDRAGGVVFFATLIVTTLLVILLLRWGSRTKEAIKRSNENGSIRLLKEYVKAKKERMCPFVEFVD